MTAQRNRQEIVKARLSRREMMRLGLVTAGGPLVVKQGLSARWAMADTVTLTEVKSNGPPSPSIVPFIQELPRIPIQQAVAANQLTGGHPATPAAPSTLTLAPVSGTSLTDGATHRVNQQLFTVNPDGTFGGTFPPVKFYELFMKQGTVRLNDPNPAFGSTTVWGFASTVNGNAMVPGPLIQARYGEAIIMRYQNNLPSVNTPAPGGFGIAEMTTHLHNGHTPSESDGYPLDYFNSSFDKGPILLDNKTNKPVLDQNGKPVLSNPLGFKDCHYPNVYAGYVHLNNAGSNSIATPAGDKNEALSSMWYHDHHLDFTAQNVYKGMFGPYNLFDARDTGNENVSNQHDPNSNIGLPSGAFDIPIFFNDFLLDKDCQLVFDLFDLDGILGDTFCANGAAKPKMSVLARRYRLRLYNPGPSRWYEFALFDGTHYLPFYQVSTDGNLLPQAVKVNSVRLSVAERADIIVDFSKTNAKRLYLVNRLEQVNGRGPTGKLLTPGTSIIQINISPLPPGTKDPSIDFADPKNANVILRQLPDPDFNALLAKADKAKTRSWEFDRSNGNWQVNGQLFDPDVISAKIPQEAEERWIIINKSGGWRHPIHMHFEEHRPLRRDGKPIPPIPSANPQVNGTIDYARRDVVPLNESNEVQVFFRWRDMKGRYVMHCHNVVHEDHAMMVRYDIT